MLWDGSRQKKWASPVDFGPLWLYRRAFLPRAFLGGPPAVFYHKKDIHAPLWDAMCTYHPDASRTQCAHRTHEGHPRQKQQTLISRNILNTATLKSSATAARQRMHTRRRVTRRPWALPPPPPSSPPPLPPPPGSTREPRDRSSGHRASW